MHVRNVKCSLTGDRGEPDVSLRSAIASQRASVTQSTTEASASDWADMMSPLTCSQRCSCPPLWRQMLHSIWRQFARNAGSFCVLLTSMDGVSSFNSE